MDIFSLIIGEFFSVIVVSNGFIFFNIAIYILGGILYWIAIKCENKSNGNNQLRSSDDVDPTVSFYCLPNAITDEERKNLYQELLTKALEIRKFEIERYWQRAVYFWGFIAACFTMYGVTVYHESYLLSYLVTILGVFTSLAFSLVLKGSKFWQLNWERHVDILESVVYGDLYKNVLFSENMCLSIISTKPWPMSVSKVNQHLANVIMLCWGYLFFSEQVRIAIRTFSFSCTDFYLHSDYVFSIIVFLAVCLYAGYMVGNSVTSDFKGYTREDLHSKNYLSRKKWWIRE